MSVFDATRPTGFPGGFSWRRWARVSPPLRWWIRRSARGLFHPDANLLAGYVRIW